jgi:hypothetical protein
MRRAVMPDSNSQQQLGGKNVKARMGEGDGQQDTERTHRRFDTSALIGRRIR